MRSRSRSSRATTRGSASVTSGEGDAGYAGKKISQDLGRGLHEAVDWLRNLDWEAARKGAESFAHDLHDVGVTVPLVVVR